MADTSSSINEIFLDAGFQNGDVTLSQLRSQYRYLKFIRPQEGPFFYPTLSNEQAQDAVDKLFISIVRHIAVHATSPNKENLGKIINDLFIYNDPDKIVFSVAEQKPGATVKKSLVENLFGIHAKFSSLRAF